MFASSKSFSVFSLAFVAVASLASVAPAQNLNVDGTIGKEIAIKFVDAGAEPFTGNVGDLFVISLPAANVVRVRTDTVPGQGDAAQRVALVKLADNIVAYFSAVHVGNASIHFEVTRSSSGTTSIEQKVIAVRVDEAQQFNAVHERDLDATADPIINCRVGDVIRIKKKKAGISALSSNSKNPAIVRRDAVVDDGTTLTFVYSVVARGNTTVGAAWSPSPGTDAGFIFVVRSE